MDTELYLVRHGETEWNKTGRFQGATDIPLSEEGILQAKRLEQRLGNHFDIIYCSPLNRAAATADLLCSNMPSVNPIPEEDFREINFGLWEGLTFSEIKDTYPAEFEQWWNGEDIMLSSGKISLSDASNKSKHAILRIREKHQGKKIVIVAHGAILKAGIIGLFDWNLNMYHKFFLGNTSVTRLVIKEDSRPMLISLNDTCHLPD